MKIYKITCKINGRFYIGQTKRTLKKRFNAHWYDRVRHDVLINEMYKDMMKYSKEDFTIELLATANTQDELNDLEVKYIKETNAICYGYNIATGKRGGDTLTYNPNLDSIREKISMKAKYSNNSNATSIFCIDIESGIKQYFGSMKECQDKLNIPRHDIIRRRCVGQIKSPYLNKYNFEYA